MWVKTDYFLFFIFYSHYLGVYTKFINLNIGSYTEFSTSLRRIV
jgi:hypothetical protein